MGGTDAMESVRGGGQPREREGFLEKLGFHFIFCESTTLLVFERAPPLVFATKKRHQPNRQNQTAPSQTSPAPTLTGARVCAAMDPIVLTEAQKADVLFITQLEDDSASPCDVFSSVVAFFFSLIYSLTPLIFLSLIHL